MKNFFNPKSVAIIGASDKKDKIGGIILNNLINFGFKGEIYPINPRHEKINKIKCYPNVLDIENSVDLAIIAIPAQFVPKVIEECAWRDKPIKNIIIISAGFSETDEEGIKLEKKIKEIAQKYELKIMGPNCLGSLSAHSKLNASFAKNNLKSGQAGLIMQSGAFTTTLMDLAQDKNFGFSLISTLGNKMSLDETDFINYFSEDDKTKVIGIYLENIKKGEEFRQSIKNAILKNKPVLILKAGNSKKTQSAILSHTGAMAGESEVSKKAIEESGGLYFQNVFEFLAGIKFFSGFKLPRNKKIAIVTNAGGPGVITTDLIENSQNLNLFEFSESQKRQIKKMLPGASSVENPIDVLGDANEDRYENVLTNLSKTNVGAVLAIVTPQAQTRIKEIIKALIVANKKYDFPILPVVMGAEAVEIANQELKEAGLINFDFPSEAISVLKNACFYKKSRKAKNEIKEIKKDIIRSKKGRTIAEKAKREGRNVFYYQESIELASFYDINCLKSTEINESINEVENDWQFPLVIKIDSPKILHKNSKQGVALNIENKKELKEVQGDFIKRFKDTKIIAQPQLEKGLEIILGIKKDPIFGPVIMCGLGGIMTEIFNEKELWLLPIDKKVIKLQLEGSKIAKVFKKQKIDLSLLVDEIFKLSVLASENKWIKELDINPMIFYSDKDPIAVDVKVVLAN